jgi:hypothetical protein
MTVSSTTSKQTFACDGTTTIFTCPFRVLAAADMRGYLITISTQASSELSNGVDFVVSAVGDANALVTTTAAYSSLYQIKFVRDTARLQLTDYRDNDPFPAEAHEEALDRLTHIAQEQDGALSRAVTLPEPEAGAELPSATSRAGKLFGFNSSTGAPEASVFTQSQVAAAVAALAPNGTSGTVILRELHTATAGQTVFNLANTYTPGVNSLLVVVDGKPLPALVDYAETNSTRVTFTAGLIAGQEVEFIIGRLVTSGVEMPQIAGASGVADHLTGGATDQASYFFRRRATYSGGTAGFVNAALWADTFVESSIGSGASTAAAYEWAIVGVMRNYSSAGENVGIYGQGLKYSTGPTWGMVAEAIDWTGAADPATGLVGLEVDNRANGTDANSSRIGIDVVATRPYTAGAPAGAAMVTSFGVRLQNGGDANASFGTGFAVGSAGAGVARAVVGFDTSAATISQAAYKMAEGQAVAFNAVATRKLYHDGSGLRFSDGSNTIIGRITDTGSFQTAGGVQVVGARNTGWAVMTGTANKAATYDTATVTTAQLAGRVMALQEALTLHGLIGA